MQPKRIQALKPYGTACVILGRKADLVVRIRHLESFASNELQAVDFVAWAVNRKFTHGDSAYYDIIRPKIRNQGKEEIWKE